MWRLISVHCHSSIHVDTHCQVANVSVTNSAEPGRAILEVMIRRAAQRRGRKQWSDPVLAKRQKKNAVWGCGCTSGVCQNFVCVWVGGGGGEGASTFTPSGNRPMYCRPYTSHLLLAGRWDPGRGTGLHPPWMIQFSGRYINCVPPALQVAQLVHVEEENVSQNLTNFLKNAELCSLLKSARNWRLASGRAVIRGTRLAEAWFVERIPPNYLSGASWALVDYCPITWLFGGRSPTTGCQPTHARCHRYRPDAMPSTSSAVLFDVSPS